MKRFLDARLTAQSKKGSDDNDDDGGGGLF